MGKSTRTAKYVLDSAYIESESKAISSRSKKRTYRWYIHYNSKEQQFEMVSMYSNWHKVDRDILIWDVENLKLTIKSTKDSDSSEYHERYGEIIFDKSFSTYIWKGENKYGNPNKPSIWKYIEKGVRIN